MRDSGVRLGGGKTQTVGVFVCVYMYSMYVCVCRVCMYVFAYKNGTM